MVGVFLVHNVLLKGRVAQSHEVVETAGGLHDGGDCFRRLLHGAQQTLESVGQNAKCILNNAAGTRETVVEDAFFIRCGGDENNSSGHEIHPRTRTPQAGQTNGEIDRGKTINKKWIGKLVYTQKKTTLDCKCS